MAGARFPDTTFLDHPPPEHTKTYDPAASLLTSKIGGTEVWNIGFMLILKCRPGYPGCDIEHDNTSMAHGLVDDKVKQEVGKTVASWEDDDGRFLILQERVRGQPLNDVIEYLSEEDLARIGWQLGEFLSHLKGCVSEDMKMGDGRPVIDRRLFKPSPPGEEAPDYTLCFTEDEVRENLAQRLRGRMNDRILNEFMARMPATKPFTFSHSDIHGANIMVEDGQFTGLIDWELAGFYPEWWDFVNCCQTISDYLPKNIQREAALRWFHVYAAIRDNEHDALVTRMNSVWTPQRSVGLAAFSSKNGSISLTVIH
ncbi:kinase-like protein [Hypoxylon trugodes]|uniref:kinase-like protein n=1 Tax=Hypoxylon trugodes TaxID=326681 RepID=UPI002194CC82|nr:kinase-like protein [Hypoxylon trugodes]KAI1388672.1 kinase-like protein [Hypoxylon trugodes]